MAKKSKPVLHIRSEGQTMCGMPWGDRPSRDLSDVDGPVINTCVECLRVSIAEHNKMISVFEDMAHRLDAIKTLSDPEVRAEFFERV